MFSLAAAVLTAGGAQAQTVVDSIVRQLERQGYREVAVSRTLLGRAIIVGRRGSRSREIVVNPRTGEILRDLWEDDVILDDGVFDDVGRSDGGSNSGPGGGGDDHSNSGSGSGNDGAGDTDDDDEDDDQDDDDEDDDVDD